MPRVRPAAGRHFLHETYADILAFTDDLDVLLTHFHSYAPPNRKWQTEGSAKVQS
jgi:hypothetical protein